MPIVWPAPCAMGRLYAASRSPAPSPGGSADAAFGAAAVRTSARHRACPGAAVAHAARAVGAASAGQADAATTPATSAAATTSGTAIRNLTVGSLPLGAHGKRVLDGLIERRAELVLRVQP